MSKYEIVRKRLLEKQKTWLVTGVAGFIGSSLLEALLSLNQKVVGLDNFATGRKCNFDEVATKVSASQWGNFAFIEGDVCNYENCEKALVGVDYVLHQAALGSVPRSIADPIASNAVNVTGFLNMLQASKDANVESFTYAASSSTYGDHPALPKVEENIGKLLSPYAVTKYTNELYAEVFSRSYGFDSIGLRYFNVFGPRQDPDGAYAAVIPKWTSALINHEPVFIYGDGETSRDFCFIENAVQANLLAAVAGDEAKNETYNIAVGDRTSLNVLFSYILKSLKASGLKLNSRPLYKDFRIGDVKHSEADISKAVARLGYKPTHTIYDGLNIAVPWYIKNLKI